MTQKPRGWRLVERGDVYWENKIAKLPAHVCKLPGWWARRKYGIEVGDTLACTHRRCRKRYVLVRHSDLAGSYYKWKEVVDE